MNNPNGNILILGDGLTLSNSFIDDLGSLYAPIDVRVTIVRSFTQIVSGPFTHISGAVTSPTLGKYQYIFTPPVTTVPGLYSAKWEGTVNGNPKVTYFNFQILDPPIDPSTILDAPRTVGKMRTSSLFRNMGLGTTDRIFLVGHASGLNLNDPYQVVNVQEAINILGADSTSPMIRGLMEAYNDGCRDIWLVAAAPITEFVDFDVDNEENRFVPRLEWGGQNFYQRYADRLATTYHYLEEWNLPEIIVPLEAPFYDTRGVDFLTPLINHCATAFAQEGNPRIGVIGTRIVNRTKDDIAAMANDSRLDNLPEAGKFVVIVVGEGTYVLPQMPTAYMCSLSVGAAAALATSSPAQGLTYKILPNVAGINGKDYTKEEIKLMANARINPIIRTQKGKRGTPFQAVIACDNTLSQEGSDYWSVAVMHVVSKCITRIRTIGDKYIGTIGFVGFHRDVQSYLQSMVSKGYIRGYNLNIVRDLLDRNQILVDVSIRPFTTVREILFTVEVGKAS